MSFQLASSADARSRVQAVAIRADRARRVRARRELAWHAAPYVAAAGVSVALIGARRGWPVTVPIAMLVVGFLILVALAVAVRSAREIDDGAAAAIDRDAGLAGELRSALWFAGRDGEDPWIGWHLDRAAARSAAVDWSRVYPRIVDRRARATTLACALVAIALALGLPRLPGPLAVNKDGRPAPRVLGTRPIAAAGIPLGLPEELQAFLAAAENGSVPVDTAANAAALRSLIEKLGRVHDAASLKALARAMGPQAEQTSRPPSDIEMKALADRAERAASNAAVPPRMRDALENLSDDLTKAAQAERTANGDPREATPGHASQDDDPMQTNAAPHHDELSIQSVRDADSGGGAAVLMVADPNAIGRDPGTGLGGGAGVDAQNGAMPDIGQALRRETVEASANTDGSDALSEVRRKSERGDATVAFTRAAPGSFDRGRASAPPAVPEQRRSTVRSYFVRQP